MYMQNIRGIDPPEREHEPPTQGVTLLKSLGVKNRREYSKGGWVRKPRQKVLGCCAS